MGGGGQQNKQQGFTYECELEICDPMFWLSQNIPEKQLVFRKLVRQLVMNKLCLARLLDMHVRRCLEMEVPSFYRPIPMNISSNRQ